MPTTVPTTRTPPRSGMSGAGGRPAASRRAPAPTRSATRRAGGASPAAPSTPTTPTTPAATFASLGVDPDLVADLGSRGFTAPFPIQTATLPDTLAGRDVLGRGRTGSGKTLAFALPLVQRLAEEDVARAGHPIGLVLAPTRELAGQIAETIRPLADAVSLSVTTIFGGVSQRPQERALAGAVDIVVACPGRLLDLMGQGVVSLDDVSMTVLDEADHMADLGFLPGVRRIMRATPARGQRLLFSATLDNGVDRIVEEFLHDPLHHAVDSSTSPTDMDHRVWMMADRSAKDDVVRRLASGTGRRILFTRTKHLARRLARRLTRDGIPAVELQGNMSQSARERAMRAFSSGQVHVMVATDIAARGIDISGVELVVHVDPPAEHKAYLHRSGRTARAGAAGTVVTLVLPEQENDVRMLIRKAGIRAGIERIRPADDAVTALVGRVAPPVAAEDMPEGVAIKGGVPGAGRPTASTARAGGRRSSTAPAPGRPTHGPAGSGGGDGRPRRGGRGGGGDGAGHGAPRGRRSVGRRRNAGRSGAGRSSRGRRGARGRSHGDRSAVRR
ncbi:DEAD/DEAH box helicase [Actinomyces gerencseriae]|uniref:DEAD/DEAH box helicase n=1 Tax=Actinomyces gerencseriae TaxID=52769 RepID=UPI0023F4724D|nr:DEAD/DEAH box helicase [Actinomyces gerencseriae]